MLGLQHPETISTTVNLSDNLAKLGFRYKALEFGEVALENRRKQNGNSHRDTLSLLGKVGFLYFSTESFQKAEQVYRELADAYNKIDGPNNVLRIDVLSNLAASLVELGKAKEVIQLLEPRRSDSKIDSYADNWQWPLIRAYLQDSRIEDAIRLATEIEGRANMTYSDDPLGKAIVLHQIGNAFFRERKWEHAARFFANVEQIRMRETGEQWQTIAIRANLAIARMELEDRPKAEMLLTDALAGLNKMFDSIPPLAKLSIARDLKTLVTETHDATGTKPDFAVHAREFCKRVDAQFEFETSRFAK